MKNADIDQCLTMSAFWAYHAMSEFSERYPDENIDHIVTLCRSSLSSKYSLDYTGGKILYQALGRAETEKSPTDCLESLVRRVLLEYTPWWIRNFVYGTNRVKEALTPDQAQCLQAAGLFNEPPDLSVIALIDELSAISRKQEDMEKMIRARKAEEMSIAYETDRLASMGLDKRPEWVSLRDNRLGYDILSYDLVNERVIRKLIEVKSASSNYIFITRNEWRNAESARSKFFFQVWLHPELSLREFSVDEIEPNIPSEKGNGIWQSVRVDINRG